MSTKQAGVDTLPAFTVRYDVITNALTTVGVGIDTRPVVPVLRGVLIVCQDGDLTVHGFNFENSLSVTLPGVATRDGRALLNHAELSKLLAAAGKGEKKSYVDSLLVTIDGAALSVDGMTMPLSTELDISDYPSIPLLAPFAAITNRAAFTAALSRVSMASGRDDILPMLTGVRVEIEGWTVVLAATDRFRLARAAVPADVGTTAKILIPAKALTAVIKRLSADDLSIGVSEKTVTLISGNVTATLRLLDAEFPKFAKLFPADRDVNTTVTVNRFALHKAVAKAALMGKAKDDGHYVRLSVGDFTVAAQPDVEGATAPELRAEVTGDSLLVRFNSAQLLDALSAFAGETVTLHWTLPNRPMTLTETDEAIEDHLAYAHLLMPVRFPD